MIYDDINPDSGNKKALQMQGFFIDEKTDS